MITRVPPASVLVMQAGYPMAQGRTSPTLTPVSAVEEVSCPVQTVDADHCAELFAAHPGQRPPEPQEGAVLTTAAVFADIRGERTHRCQDTAALAGAQDAIVHEPQPRLDTIRADRPRRAGHAVLSGTRRTTTEPAAGRPLTGGIVRRHDVLLTDPPLPAGCSWTLIGIPAWARAQPPDGRRF